MRIGKTTALLLAFCGVLLSCCGGSDHPRTEIKLSQWPQLVEELRETDGFRMGEPGHEVYLGEGWDEVEQDPDGRFFRWALGDTVEVMVPIVRRHALKCRIRWARPPLGEGQVQGTIFLFNGTEMGRTSISSHRFNDFELSIPQDVVKTGLNVLRIVPSMAARIPGDPRPLRFCVREIGWEAAVRREFRELSPKTKARLKNAVERASVMGLSHVSQENALAVHLHVPRGSIIRGRIHHLGVDGGETVRVSIIGAEMYGEERILWAHDVDPEPTPTVIRVPMGHAVDWFVLRADEGDVAGVGIGDMVIEAPVVPDAGKMIALVTIDGLRADMIQRSSTITPRMDEIARSGVVFMRAYAPSTLRMPVYCSLMSGAYPFVHGVYDDGHSLSSMTSTLATELRAQGYTCIASVADPVLHAARQSLGRGYSRFDGPIDRSFSAAKQTDRIIRLLFANWHRLGKSLLWMQFADLTPPFDPPDEYVEMCAEFGWAEEEDLREAQVRYMATVSFIDSQIGKIHEAMQVLGLTERGVFVMTGGFGMSLGEHGAMEDHATLFQEVMHVPLVIAAPGRAAPASMAAAPVSLIDLFPTFLDLAGVSMAQRDHGRSLAPVLAGEAMSSRPVFSESEGGMSVASVEWPYKLIQATDSAHPPVYLQEESMLFDLERDPGEQEDLASIQQSQAEGMWSRWSAFLDGSGARFRSVSLSR